MLFDTIGTDTVAVIKNREQSFNIFDAHSSDLHGIPHLLGWELHLRWLPRVITNIILTERELENET